MKLSFSTLGCPGWSWSEIYLTAKEFAYDGIEIRGIGEEMSAPRMPMFSSHEWPAIHKQLSDASLSIPILTSSACLGLVETAGHVAEAKRYIDLAAAAGVPCVRVMITGVSERTGADVQQARALYRQLCEYAAGTQVRVLIETNDELADSNVIAGFMENVPAENSGILWDVHHTFRNFGESPAHTWKALGQWVKHVHIYDSAMENGKVSYRMIGHGDVPVIETVTQLKKGGYTGFVSLEWKKRWLPDLEDPGIVFAHFKNYMDYLIELV